MKNKKVKSLTSSYGIETKTNGETVMTQYSNKEDMMKEVNNLKSQSLYFKAITETHEVAEFEDGEDYKFVYFSMDLIHFLMGMLLVVVYCGVPKDSVYAIVDVLIITSALELGRYVYQKYFMKDVK